MKTLIFILACVVFGCENQSETIESVPIRVDKTDPDFKDTTRYILHLESPSYSSNWYLILRGSSHYLDTSLTENGDTVVSLVHANLGIDQNEDLKKLNYNMNIFELDSSRLIPKMRGKSHFIYQTPMGIDTAYIEIDKNLIPKLLDL